MHRATASHAQMPVSESRRWDRSITGLASCGGRLRSHEPEEQQGCGARWQLPKIQCRRSVCVMRVSCNLQGSQPGTLIYVFVRLQVGRSHDGAHTEICHRTWWPENTDGLRGLGWGNGSKAATDGSQHSRNAKAVVPVHVRYEDSALHMSTRPCLSSPRSLLANMPDAAGVQGGHAHGSGSLRALR